MAMSEDPTKHSGISDTKTIKSEKSLPEGADGDNSILLDNGKYKVDIGETESGTWIWEFDGHTTLFHEYFAFQDNNSENAEVIPSYDESYIDNKKPFIDEGEPGEDYAAVIEYDIGGHLIQVVRRVQMPADSPVLTVTYEVSNLSEDSVIDLNFFQYADFDDGSNDYWDDIAYFDESKTLAYTRDEAGDAYAGFSSDKDPVNHHVGEYPGYSAVNSDSLNNKAKFPESGSDDPVVAMEWDIGELEPQETGKVTVQFGAENDEDEFKSNVEDPEPISPTSEIEASVTTLQFIPGGEENVTRGGNPLNSSLMRVFDDVGINVLGRDLGVEPVLDSWLEGDMRDDLPTRLSEAQEQKSGKYEDEFGSDPFNEYRFENGIEVSFETEEDETIDSDTVEIQFSESGDLQPDDSNVSLEGRENSRTVTPDQEVNGIPVDEWHGAHVQTSNRRPRWYNYDTDFEHEGVEGVRVVTVAGGWAGFVQDWSRRVGDSPALFFNEVWGWDIPEFIAKRAMLAAPLGMQPFIDYMSVVPNTYSFIEFIVLADGRRYARVWDASIYPSLATYVDKRLQELEKMPYNTDERFNANVFAFMLEASVGVTPYHTPLDFYSRLIKDDDLREGMLQEPIQDLIDLLPVGWGVNELMSDVPRATVGLDSYNGEPLDEQDAPFGLAEGLLFPLANKVESE